MSSRVNPWNVIVAGLAAMFILIGVAAVVGVITKTPVQFQNYFSWIGSLLGLFIGLFFLFIFIVVVAWVFRMFRHSAGFYRDNRWDWWSRDGAADILKERYARGEVTRQQFDQMMNDIERRGK